jgi:hypothetical protein
MKRYTINTFTREAHKKIQSNALTKEPGIINLAGLSCKSRDSGGENTPLCHALAKG